MKPVAMKTGEFVKEVRTEWGTYNVSCFAKVPGNSLEDTKGGLSIIRGYGQILGKLHSLMKDYPCSEKHRSHEDLLKEIGNRIKEYDAPEEVDRKLSQPDGQGRNDEHDQPGDRQGLRDLHSSQ